MFRLLRTWLIKDTCSGVVQFLRYGVVGGLSFLVDFGTLAFCASVLHIHYLLGAALGFCFGLIVNYVFSVAWVFPADASEPQLQTFIAFAVIGVVGLGVNEIGMWMMTGCAGMDYRLSKLGTTVLVFLWNFFARKYLVFSRSNQDPSGVG